MNLKSVIKLSRIETTHARREQGCESAFDRHLNSIDVGVPGSYQKVFRKLSLNIVSVGLIVNYVRLLLSALAVPSHSGGAVSIDLPQTNGVAGKRTTSSHISREVRQYVASSHPQIINPLDHHASYAIKSY
jgi:hypothetical protein